LENVPFMLQLDRGQAMHYLTTELARLGFRWAYRVVDARSFGPPQRRQRVILLATVKSRRRDPKRTRHPLTLVSPNRARPPFTLVALSRLLPSV
jgi:DNA (cytosine-5)-methyltransferase 1